MPQNNRKAKVWSRKEKPEYRKTGDEGFSIGSEIQ
jgi:hypothetical protein